MKKLYILLSIVSLSIASQAQVVISQVYGGGGNGTTTPATYSNDFIELYNRGTLPQNLSGWSIQYASATGVSWGVHALPDFTLQPGQYFLIQEAAGATPSVALPTPDFNGVGVATSATATAPFLGLALSGSKGKVILVNSIVAETTTNPTGAQILDKFGYGTTSLGFETAPFATVLTNTTSAQRNSGGCDDSDNNATDFTAAVPAARNSSSPFNNCSLSVNQNSISGLNVYPNPVVNGNLFITSESNEAKQVTIFDVLGKVVINATITNQPLNVNALNKGIYILKIAENGKTATRKLVIK